MLRPHDQIRRWTVTFCLFDVIPHWHFRHLWHLGALEPADTKRPDAPQLAPYVPTPQEVVDRMLALANVQKSDFVVDLGCGDGRIPVTAAKKYGARGLGVDIDPVRIAEANANAKAAGVTHLVTFKLQDALKTDVSTATVVTTYLLSASNLRLRPILTKQLKPGSRIVTHYVQHGRLGAGEIRHVQRRDRPHADDLLVSSGRQGASVTCHERGAASSASGESNDRFREARTLLSRPRGRSGDQGTSRRSSSLRLVRPGHARA